MSEAFGFAGGNILPMQQAGLTTAKVRSSPLTLLITFDRGDSAIRRASGHLYLDNGEQAQVL